MRTYTVDQVATYLAKGYWEDRGRYQVNLGPTVTVNLNTLNADNQRLAKLALDAWAELGLKFTYVTGRAELMLDDNSGFAHTIWDRPGGLPTVRVGPSYSDDFYGSKTSQAWLHEIGHALGLGHTGDYNFWADYGYDNHFRNDTLQMSVMSYFTQDNYKSASFAYVMTPMPADIAAIQKIYGDIARPGLGNTTYFWDTNATGIHGEIGRMVIAGEIGSVDADGDRTEPFSLTIMDKSGVDTLNFRGSDDAVEINLTPGSINSAFGLTGNVLIERATVIENVIGSTEADLITGQSANNRLSGGDGNDRIFGGGGHDSILGDDGHDLLFGNEGNDKIAGGAGNDKLVGGGGQDVLDGGAGIDAVIYHGASVSIDLLRPAEGRGAATGDVLKSIENINAANLNDRLFGNDVNNRLYGNGGNDILDGRRGNDMLDGGSGNDHLNGGLGDDLLKGGAGTDRIIVGAGRDTVVGGQDADQFVFTGGRMTVSDFSGSVGGDGDTLLIDRAAIGNAALTIDALLDTAELIFGTDTQLDLGLGRYVRLVGITDAATLADDLIMA